MKTSLFAPSRYPKMPSITGCKLSTTEVGIKYNDRADLFLAAFEPGTVVAGTFTKSKTASGAVEWGRKYLAAGGDGRGLIVNAGNANAFTGALGEKSVELIGDYVAKILNCAPGEVFQASTGVIGEPLADDLIVKGIQRCGAHFEASYADCARAIMTTDTYPKFTSHDCMIEGEKITLNGIAKGSGMIAPDMATMLAFFFTDMAIEKDVLQKVVSGAVAKTFNCITVDGDTSTSDTVLVFATNKAKMVPITDAKDPRLKPFTRLLKKVFKELALMIVKDGEGLSKFVTIKVRGAKGSRAAKKIAMSIANSPLVKTAIAGQDPNWGRIIMAVGKAGEEADRDRLDIFIGGHLVTKNGARIHDYDEAPLAAHMQTSNILIEVDIGLGRGRAEVWTCDLTHDYISINADYRS